MNSKLASNSTQNSSPAWVNPMVSGAYGLIGLVVVVALAFCAIRFLALQARLSDPQRALTDHFVRQVAEMQKAEKAKKKMEEKKAKKVRWRQWSLEGLVGFFGLSLPSLPATSNEDMVQNTGINRSDGVPHRPILHIIVEEAGSTSTAEAESKLEDVDCNGVVLRWVRVPRGYPLPPKSKKASTLAEVVGALQGGK
ncbi:hypothetical protein N7530_003513 [Penicillium desertorum]|uniref:Uncharacterized protein n=1 Tax=Penicillium desertorum TaxID=1303715 RepID=A0A9W9WWJ9_9EURO|nr:hypothetical protein N7530_003513 [Penicillium desertorum]